MYLSPAGHGKAAPAEGPREQASGEGVVCICPLQAMGKLHQLKVLGSRPLVVEYADPKHKEVMQEAEKDR